MISLSLVFDSWLNIIEFQIVIMHCFQSEIMNKAMKQSALWSDVGKLTFSLF